MREIRQKLQKQSKQWLIDQLVELSSLNQENADRLIMSITAHDGDGSECIKKFKQQLNKAAEEIVRHGPGSWKSQVPTTGFDSVANALAVLMPKNVQAVVEISEHALIKLDGVFELQDECELEYLVDGFRQLHLEACYKLKPDARALGARLAKLGKQTEWGFFDGPPDGYGAVLGQEGLNAFLSGTRSAKAKRY